jgi:hypothetical protein
MNEILLGATAMGGLTASLFFIRFWRQTRDRLFLIFAIAFGVDAVMRITLAATTFPDEQEPFFYLGRLLTFVLIVLAIADKNRKERN